MGKLDILGECKSVVKERHALRKLKFILIVSLALALWPGMIQSQEQVQFNDRTILTVPLDTVDLLRNYLKNGTPPEKEAALYVILNLKPIQLIPEIIEAIEDPTPLPRHGDTGWGFVGHQASTVLGLIAKAMDGIDVKSRGRGYDAYSFHNDEYKGGEKLRDLGRLSEVRKNWEQWWFALQKTR